MTEDEWKALDKKMRLWEEWRQKKAEEDRLKKAGRTTDDGQSTQVR